MQEKQDRSLKRRLFKWRRDIGLFQEKRVRKIAEFIKLSHISSFEISCTRERNYQFTVTTDKPTKLAFSVSPLGVESRSIHASRTHKVGFYSKSQRALRITLENLSDEECLIELAEIQMGGGSGCDNAQLHFLFSQGHLYKVLETYANSPHKKEPNIIIRTRGFIELLEKGIETVDIPEQPAENNNPYLYQLYSAISFNLSGYTTRSHSILKHLRANAHTRLGYPEIVERHINSNLNLVSKYPQSVNVDGINYNHFHEPECNYPGLTSLEYISKSAQCIAHTYKDAHPKGIISASNYINGYIGYKASRLLGVPFAYEMRGLWHITGLTKNPDLLGSDQYKLAERCEIDLAEKAEKVFVLSQAMKEWLSKKGIATDKIQIAPNGVNLSNFSEGPKPLKLVEKFKCQKKHVFGFIGSLAEYEGVDLFIKAFKALSKIEQDVSLIIVGDGQHRKSLEKEAKDHANIHFVGRVPHDKVLSYYHLCDTMVYARNSNLVCQLVPPLKPLEAMATGKLIICSDVPPLMDYLDNGKNGLSFKTDSLEDLLKNMQKALQSGPEINKIKKNAKQFIAKHHQWEQVAKTLAFMDPPH